jgi:hypothetical protein
MTSNALSIVSVNLPELPFTVSHIKPERRKIEIIKLPATMSPGEKKIRELNELAARHPFCVLHKPKKHDTL